MIDILAKMKIRIELLSGEVIYCKDRFKYRSLGSLSSIYTLENIIDNYVLASYVTNSNKKGNTICPLAEIISEGIKVK